MERRVKKRKDKWGWISTMIPILVNTWHFLNFFSHYYYFFLSLSSSFSWFYDIIL